ncbi:MAG: ATP-binding protein [Marmoricola sp.]
MTARAGFLTTFVGRRRELDAVLDAVLTTPLVTLVGGGGIGKTRLAHQVLELARVDPARSWVVELADLHDADLIADRISAAIGAPTAGADFDASALVAAIGEEGGVLLLDNCEHLLTACADLVTMLLRGCPGLHVLTTSRQPLGVIGEHVFLVPPLDRSDAVVLFGQRAKAVLPTWSTPEDDATVDAMCRTLDGVPLAIELVAAQARMFPPHVLLDRLQDRLSLTGQARGEPLRLTSVEASIRWSHDLCTEGERLLWQRLSVFAGGFSLEAAEDACSGEGLARSDVLEALAGLVDKSVVLRQGDGDRYSMLEMIRQFGLDRLAEDADPEGWQRRHRDHYLALAERFESEWWGPGQVAWMARLHQERRNLELAFAFSASAAGEARAVLRMSAVLEHFFASTGGGGEAVHWLRTALGHAVGTEVERANALRIGSFVANLVGQIETSAELYAELEALAAASSDRRIRAHALYAASQLRTYSSEIEDGIAAAVAGVAVLHDLGMDGLEANLHFLGGMIMGWADRPDEAAREYRACLKILEPRGERWLTSYAQWGLGLDALSFGDVRRALELEVAALRAKAEFGDQLGIGLTLEAIAWAVAEQRRVREAALLLGGAAAIWERIGMSVAAMPYISRRRDAGVALIRTALTAREYDDLVAQGKELPQELVVSIAVGDVRAPEVTTGHALTRREREVAELVADGASNRAIAEQLVLSVRTVETHVENLLRKLGVPARGDVARALAPLRGE